MGTLHMSSSNHGLSHHSYRWFWFNLPASNLIPFPPSLNIVCNQSPRWNFMLRFPVWHCFMCTSLRVTCTYVQTHNADHSARTWMYKAKYSRTSTDTVTSKAVCTVAVPFRVSRACGERPSNREKVTRISWQQPAASSFACALSRHPWGYGTQGFSQGNYTTWGCGSLRMVEGRGSETTTLTLSHTWKLSSGPALRLLPPGPDVPGAP